MRCSKHTNRFQRRDAAHDPKPPRFIGRSDERPGNAGMDFGGRSERGEPRYCERAIQATTDLGFASLTRPCQNRPFDGLAMLDCRAQHLQAFAHECGQARPAFGGDQIAVCAGAARLDIDVIPPARRTSGSQYWSAATRLPFTTPSTAISTCTPWQIVKIGFPVSWKWRMMS